MIKRIDQIEPINEGYGAVLNRADIARIVEEPLVKACEILYDKNIISVSSHANIKSSWGTNDVPCAFIAIERSSLSDENKAIAAKLESTKYSTDEIVFLVIEELTSDSDPDEIEKKAIRLVEEFKAQALLLDRSAYKGAFVMTWQDVANFLQDNELGIASNYSPEKVSSLISNRIGIAMIYDPNRQVFDHAENVRIRVNATTNE